MSNAYVYDSGLVLGRVARRAVECSQFAFDRGDEMGESYYRCVVLFRFFPFLFLRTRKTIRLFFSSLLNIGFVTETFVTVSFSSSTSKRSRRRRLDGNHETHIHTCLHIAHDIRSHDPFFSSYLKPVFKFIFFFFQEIRVKWDGPRTTDRPTPLFVVSTFKTIILAHGFRVLLPKILKTNKEEAYNNNNSIIIYK